MKVVTYRELKSAIDVKVPHELRAGKHSSGPVVVDGVKVLWFGMPHVHRGDVPIGTLNAIRGQLRLSKEQFGDLIDCPLSRDQFESHARKYKPAKPDSEQTT